MFLIFFYFILLHSITICHLIISFSFHIEFSFAGRCFLFDGILQKNIHLHIKCLLLFNKQTQTITRIHTFLEQSLFVFRIIEITIFTMVITEHTKSTKISLSLLNKFLFSQGLYDGRVNSMVKFCSLSITARMKTITI
jgi:hypothetical protein